MRADCRKDRSNSLTLRFNAALSARAAASALLIELTSLRTGTCGMTWSTRCAAVCDMRRAPQEGQIPGACS